MWDILADLARWRGEKKSIALATVVQTWGSSPRGVGSKMIITSDGRFAGSVSGGCVENAIVEAGIQSLKANQPKLLHFGVADETAWEVGLACGGSIDIFVNPLDNEFIEEFRSALENERKFVNATVIHGPDNLLGRELLIYELGSSKGWLGNYWNGQIDKLVSKVISQGTSQRVALDDEKVTRSTAIVTLTYDPKLGDPAFILTLSSQAFYVGTLGSKTTQAKRRERLLHEGLAAFQLYRLHGPIGLDINSQTPEEISLAIMVDVVQVPRKRKQAPVGVEVDFRLTE